MDCVVGGLLIQSCFESCDNGRHIGGVNVYLVHLSPWVTVSMTAGAMRARLELETLPT